MVFISGPRFTRAGETNWKGASGSGRFRVGEQVWRGGGIRDACFKK